MSLLAADTPAHIEQIQIERLRRMPPWRKLALLGQLNQTATSLAMSGLRRRHPGETEQELRRRLADLLLGPELAIRAYGPVSSDPRSPC